MAEFYAIDQLLMDDPPLLERYLGFGGKFIGLLFWRPQNSGCYGRYTVEKFKAEKV